MAIVLRTGNDQASEMVESFLLGASIAAIVGSLGPIVRAFIKRKSDHLNVKLRMGGIEVSFDPQNMEAAEVERILSTLQRSDPQVTENHSDAGQRTTSG